ncbi:MAG: bifunctional [glutamine synthetase] adenylyltransferase/[glutamine synthetase]-adenylyl-L-tyrosine phosphorylase [Hyphomicrobiaceae bacterium]|nr:bifunctional [glutamine synthetase] adenylyltransferase/[glutamine synthetase]-adenylyl-L-tyrosine phosphorylase [Hyphomicrobiaceae bacterium]
MTTTAPEAGPVALVERIRTAPKIDDGERAARVLAELGQRVASDRGLDRLGELLERDSVRALVAGIAGASPFLADLMLREAVFLQCVLEADPETLFERLSAQAFEAVAAASGQPDAMRLLRQYKTRIALLIALADIGGAWPVMTVTRHLSLAADTAVAAAVRFLFRQAHGRGEWQVPEPSGYIVLAMGKHGAFELNYSSDIDLIVLYDPARTAVQGGDIQTSLVRITRALVKLLQERTEHGYVFRTDLRLRPDPGSTPLAISTDAALNYYETVGQNWERAALIKARPIAGDLEAGAEFLKALAPFIWRKYLDFAAIADIHAMKRQIHAFRGFGEIRVAGHNIKLGRGGIREIEFFVQTQQLIAGGRQLALRVRDTLSGLGALQALGWITQAARDELAHAYGELRTIEHRLQMVADEQTQTLPQDEAKLRGIACFLGYQDVALFAADLVRILETVQRHYARLFEHSPELTARGANMVFAGEEDDPDTVAALSEMGYKEPQRVIGLVRGWHHGRYPAVRTPRARELLTEMQPVLIEALSKTVDPDLAMLGFDKFLSELPSGVQLFSLLKQNPSLLDLIAAIMGTAPRLAGILSRRRRVFDAVLAPGFFGSLATRESLAALIGAEIGGAHDFQEKLDRARVVVNEQAFLIGVRVLTGTVGAGEAGGAYALLAEETIKAMHAEVTAEIERSHGRVPGGASAIVAMGKLGGREMTAASDLDLIVIYDFDERATLSSGVKPLAPTQYFTRLTQRLISALTAQTSEGKLYDVDMRLRPSGQKGPVATQLSSFVAYQNGEAWTWEHMALTRARAISGPAHLCAAVERTIREVLAGPREQARIAADVRDMRARIEKEKGTHDIWDLKQVRGGLVDLEFIAQHLQLVHAHRHPEVLSQSTLSALRNLSRAGLIDDAAAETLVPAAQLLSDLTQVLRLCVEGTFEPQTATHGLKALLARSAGLPDFNRLEAELKATQAAVLAEFDRLVR